jgi:MbtH protein
MTGKDLWHVLRNDEGQYSVWRSALSIPNGWTSVRTASTEAECLAYIERVWDDIRPLSSR